MCADTSCLALRLQGPMQSWGSESQYNRRTTHAMPSKSAIAGMLCAAKGAARGSTEESTLLAGIAQVRMLAVAMPQRAHGESHRQRTAARMVDFHTVQNTRISKIGLADCHVTCRHYPTACLKTKCSKLKLCHITRRHYLNDASFYVFLMGKTALLQSLHDALADPVWGLWLGRKCCVPSAPVLGGLFATEAEACAHLLKAPLEDFTHERDVESFDEGSDSLPDHALCFASSTRRFVTRRVLRVRAKAAIRAE